MLVVKNGYEVFAWLRVPGQNIFSAIVTLALVCSGSITAMKAQGLLLMSLVVLIVNLVNLVILEVGEWRGFLDEQDRKFIQDHDLEEDMYHGEFAALTVFL